MPECCVDPRVSSRYRTVQSRRIFDAHEVPKTWRLRRRGKKFYRDILVAVALYHHGNGKIGARSARRAFESSRYPGVLACIGELLHSISIGSALWMMARPCPGPKIVIGNSHHSPRQRFFFLPPKTDGRRLLLSPGDHGVRSACSRCLRSVTLQFVFYVHDENRQVALFSKGLVRDGYRQHAVEICPGRRFRNDAALTFRKTRNWLKSKGMPSLFSVRSTGIGDLCYRHRWSGPAQTKPPAPFLGVLRDSRGMSSNMRPSTQPTCPTMRMSHQSSRAGAGADCLLSGDADSGLSARQGLPLARFSSDSFAPRSTS